MRRVTIVCAVVAMLGVPAPTHGVPGAAAGGLASDNVEFVANIPEPGAFGGRILGNTMYVTTTQGVRIFDVSSPLGIPVPLGALPLPHFGNEDVDTNGEILLVATDHGLTVLNTLYVVDVSNPHLPTLAARLDTSPFRAHTVTCIQECRYAWLAGSNAIGVVDLADPSDPQIVGRFYQDGTDNPNSGGFDGHDVNVDEAGIAWVSGGDGLFAFDPSQDPVRPTPVAARPNGGPQAFDNQFIIHNSMRPDAAEAGGPSFADDSVDPGELVLVTEEDWLSPSNGLCEQDGAFQTGWVHDVDGRTVVERLDTFSLGRMGDPTRQKPQPVATCSSHWFDHRDDGVVAVAWYEQGIRFLDTSDPRSITELGYFVPASSSASAALWHNGFVYTFDLVRGMDVLQFTGSAGDPAVAPPPLRPVPSTLAAEPHPVYGYACLIPTPSI